MLGTERYVSVFKKLTDSRGNRQEIRLLQLMPHEK